MVGGCQLVYSAYSYYLCSIEASKSGIHDYAKSLQNLYFCSLPGTLIWANQSTSASDFPVSAGLANALHWLLHAPLFVLK